MENFNDRIRKVVRTGVEGHGLKLFANFSDGHGAELVKGLDD